MNDAFLRGAEEGLKILTVADVMGQMDSASQPFSFAFLKEKNENREHSNGTVQDQAIVGFFSASSLSN